MLYKTLAGCLMALALLGAGCGPSEAAKTNVAQPTLAMYPEGFDGTNEDCFIKGNISSSKEKIYHRPGDRYYDATEIDEASGERWFCDEPEALAAGWRKTKR